MRKRLSALLIVSVLFLFVEGCGKEMLPNTYIPGSDYQYAQFSAWQSLQKIQYVEGGAYLVNEQYIYFLDETTDTIVPLCNKVNCLHDKEIDIAKKSECNAYIENKPINNQIQYYEGAIYYLDWGRAGQVAPAVYKVSADGTKKEKVYQWSNDEIFIDKWALHRGVIYYTDYVLKLVENTETGKEEITQLYTVSGLPISGMSKKPTAILSQEEDLKGYIVNDIGFPRAYGNFVYFSVWAYKEMEEECNSESSLDYLYYKEYVYDIVNEEYRIVTKEDMQKSEIFQLAMFWENRVVYYLFDFDKEIMTPTDIYVANLDGTNVEVFMNDVPLGYNLMTDGNLLYMTNDNEVSACSLDEEKTYWIYNQDLELIDTYHLPYEIFGDRPMGTPECQYILIPDEEGLGFKVLRWDKENIGNYQGSDIEVTKIVYSVTE